MEKNQRIIHPGLYSVVTYKKVSKYGNKLYDVLITETHEGNYYKVRKIKSDLTLGKTKSVIGYFFTTNLDYQVDLELKWINHEIEIKSIKITEITSYNNIIINELNNGKDSNNNTGV